MPKFENYQDVLNENAAGRHVLGSSLATLALLGLFLLAVSL